MRNSSLGRVTLSVNVVSVHSLASMLLILLVVLTTCITLAQAQELSPRNELVIQAGDGQGITPETGDVGLQNNLMNSDISEKYRLIEYVAVALDKPSIFSEGTLIDFRYVAEGRCGECSDENIKKMCQGVQQRDCGAQPKAGMRRMCEAMLYGTVYTVEDTYKSLQVDFPGEVPKNKIVRALGIYSGFKGKGREDCQKYLDVYAADVGPAMQYFVCRLAFSSDSLKEVKIVETNLTFFEMGQQEVQYCAKISDGLLKTACEKMAAAGSASAP